MIEVDSYEHDPFRGPCDMCGGPGPCLYAVRGGTSRKTSLFTHRGSRATTRERTLRVCGDECREAATVSMAVEFSDRPVYEEEPDEAPSLVVAQRPARRSPP